MRIGIVGGVERLESHYAKLGKAAGHEVALHDGHTKGRGMNALAQLVDRSDVVIIVTEINSHGAVLFARHRLRGLGREPLLVRRFGLQRFAAFLAELGPSGGRRAA